MSNLKNTIGYVKQLLGRAWSDPKLQSELKNMGPCNDFVELPGDRVGVKVTYRGEPLVLTPEQLAGMLFAKLRHTTESSTNVKVQDVVVSVPGWFNEAQRKALLDAIHLGGMTALKVVNDMAAISLSWGLVKTELDEKNPTRVMLIDIGEQAMSVGITEFTKSQAKIISTAYNTEVSGGAVNLALATHFAEEFLAKKKVDLRHHPKAWFRLLAAVGRVKKILNTNPSAPLNVECIYEEYDINSLITRDTYADLIKDVVAKVPVAVEAALARAGLKPEQIDSVEIVGSGGRTQLFQHAIHTYLGKEIHQTLNAEEAVAKGCALQCAILSPHFRVREYHLVDIVDHPIVCTWQTIKDPSDTTQRRVVIFDRTSTWPAAKNVSFHRAECKPFEVKIHYDTTGEHAVDIASNPVLSVVTIDHVPRPAEGPDADVRLKIRKNGNGLIEVADCELVEKYEEVETPSPAASPSPATGEAPAAVPATAMDVDQKAPADAAAAEPTKKKKVRYTSIPFTVKHTYGQSAATLAEWAKMEAKMAEETRQAVAITDAKNAVESYVYNTRDSLFGSWAPYVTEGDASTLSAKLDEAGDWLYGDGEDETKDVYETKLLSLHALGDPIEFRLHEHSARDAAVANFESVLSAYHAKVVDTSDKYEHISAEDKQKVNAEIEKLRAWLAPLLAKTKAAPLTADPAFHTKDLKTKTDALSKMADLIFNKPKPKPKPVEKPAAAEQPASNETPPAAETHHPNGEHTSTANEKPAADAADNQMEVD